MNSLPACGGGLGRGVSFTFSAFAVHPPPCPSPSRGEERNTSAPGHLVFVDDRQTSKVSLTSTASFTSSSTSAASVIRWIARRARWRYFRRPAKSPRCRLKIMCARIVHTVRFASDMEREWFRLLQTVQGVGAEVALSVLGTLKVFRSASAIAMRDKAAVARRPASARKSPSGSSRIEGQGAGLCLDRSGRDPCSAPTRSARPTRRRRGLRAGQSRLRPAAGGRGHRRRRAQSATRAPTRRR